MTIIDWARELRDYNRSWQLFAKNGNNGWFQQAWGTSDDPVCDTLWDMDDIWGSL